MRRHPLCRPSAVAVGRVGMIEDTGGGHQVRRWSRADGGLAEHPWERIQLEATAERQLIEDTGRRGILRAVGTLAESQGWAVGGILSMIKATGCGCYHQRKRTIEGTGARDRRYGRASGVGLLRVGRIQNEASSSMPSFCCGSSWRGGHQNGQLVGLLRVSMIKGGHHQSGRWSGSSWAIKKRTG
jgi:hypothetical protein